MAVNSWAQSPPCPSPAEPPLILSKRSAWFLGPGESGSKLRKVIYREGSRATEQSLQKVLLT